MKYKIGDKVKIKSWETLLNEYGEEHFFTDDDGSEYFNFGEGGCFKVNIDRVCKNIYTIKDILETYKPGIFAYILLEENSDWYFESQVEDMEKVKVNLIMKDLNLS